MNILSKAFFFLLFLTLAPKCISIERLKDSDISKLLETLKHEESKQFKNFKVNFFSTREYGECDGKPTTCPKSTLYIVVATTDLHPDVGIYKLPPSFGWEVKSVKEVDSIDEYQRYISVDLKNTLPSSNWSESWWKTEIVRIDINPWNIKSETNE